MSIQEVSRLTLNLRLQIGEKKNLDCHTIEVNKLFSINKGGGEHMLSLRESV